VDYMGPNPNLQIFDTFKELVFHTHAVKQEAGTGGGQLDGSAEEKPGFVFILALTRYHIDGKRDGLQMQVNSGRRHPPRRRGYDALNPLTIDTDSLLGTPVVLFPKLIFALSTDDLHEGRKKAIKKEKEQFECEKEQCSQNKLFGFPGEAFPRFCKKHKMDGMETIPNNKESRGKRRGKKEKASGETSTGSSSFEKPSQYLV